MMEPLSENLDIVLAASCFLVVCWLLFKRLSFSPLANLRGPPSSSLIFGNVMELQHQEDAGELEYKWISQYGEACKISGAFGQELLMLADPKALHHIVQASGYRYPKPSDTNQSIRLIMGRGIFWASGDDHKRHKKVMNPAFDINRLRSFLPLFQSSAQMLARKWKGEIDRNGGLIDVTTWISRLMLDNIGEAAFEHKFNAVDAGGVGELSEAFNNLFAESLLFPDKGTVFFISLWRFIPPSILRYVEYLPARQVRRFRQFLKVSKQAAKNLINYRASNRDCEDENKDILSLLVRSNSSVDPKRRLDEDELLSQMATIMLAGHDSTAMSLSWLLYDLARNPEDQKRVREEVLAMKAQSPTPDCLGVNDFEAMTFTNAVIKETLRLHPIAFMLPRIANQDDIIPLASPITTKSGERISEIPIREGQSIYMAVYTYNRLKHVWGDDADRWNPGRFLSDTKDKDKEYTMGMFANLLTFSGGVRGCLGWRFAILELQATLVGLIQHFEFSPPPGIDIQGAPAGSMIPVIRGRAKEGTQLPLRISVLTPDDGGES
ncbi:cytochrome P450 [Gymnopilus junonius]|uniref:Cytochrome P450 n=1 Tax=Gymnopilus junonius TaxID=109634 RepID=A0A9P5TNR5_GYMJU|nr:cytochrome P450 [Gymnopilus junonius]